MTLRIVDSYTVKKLRAERNARFAAVKSFHTASDWQTQNRALMYLTRKYYKVSTV